MWFKRSKWYFCEIANFAYGGINERSFSNPHPRSPSLAAATMPHVMSYYALGFYAESYALTNHCRLWMKYLTQDEHQVHIHKISTRLCCVFLCCNLINCNLWINLVCLPISFRVASLAPGQSYGQLYDCPSASKVTLKHMGKLKGTHNKTQ